MVKNLKINIKNSQLAQALNIDSILEKKKKTVSKKVSKKGKDSEKKEESKKPKARIVAPPSLKKKEEIEEALIEPSIKTPLEEEPPLEEKKEESEVVAVEEIKPEEEETTSSLKKKEEKEEDPSSEKLKKKAPPTAETPAKKGVFRDNVKKKTFVKTFDSRDKQGLRDLEDERWRKKRSFKSPKKQVLEEEIIRPKSLKVRVPITIKDLAQEMKLKASQLISKLFMQGLVLTLNDYLDDETTIQLLGHEFGCDIALDFSEEEKLRITDKTIAEEIAKLPSEKLSHRPAVVTFMGHVDHGKTSLIDAIRKSNRASQEAGSITQHIGAFKVKTHSGDTITILDTPGHEAFSLMRERGANVTDLAILVVAGDEGMREQSIEAMNQAKEAKVPILVAINKSDKEGFDDQKVYRQLAEHELLPESWGGTTITVNCSATTKKGIEELLEMISLQAEVLELKASSELRARGSVLESQMHKGMGAVATVLVQNGTLKKGDPLVLGHHWGRVKTMQDETGSFLSEATPSTPVKITGLSDVVEAGAEFIVVSTEKEAKDLAEARHAGKKHQAQMIKKKGSLESLLEEKVSLQKILPLILRADVQGSLEALKQSLFKLPMKKVRLEIVSEGIGEISESDIELAAASKAVILGFHTNLETRAEPLKKQKGVSVKIHDIIYHAVEDIRNSMIDRLDKIPEEKDTGKAKVKAIFKASHLGNIAGCQVTEGTIHRNHLARLSRGKEILWKGKIASLKRVKEDVKEVQKGTECGILLEGFNEVAVDDLIEAYEIIYHTQTLE